MANSDLILELLDVVFPNSYCDDCLSNELGIQPRQQVNQIAHRLELDGKTIRQRGICSSCRKPKTTSSIKKSSSAQSNPKTITSQESQAANAVSVNTAPVKEIDIEHARTEIVQICRQIWEKNSQDVPPPHSISSTINLLKNDNLLPAHQANLMLTICSLRNVLVYENIQMGHRENEIAANALSIILEWWNHKKK